MFLGPAFLFARPVELTGFCWNREAFETAFFIAQAASQGRTHALRVQQLPFY